MIAVDREGRVALLRIDRPDRAGALTSAMLTGLADAWTGAQGFAQQMEEWPDADIGPGGASLPSPAELWC